MKLLRRHIRASLWASVARTPELPKLRSASVVGWRWTRAFLEGLQAHDDGPVVPGEPRHAGGKRCRVECDTLRVRVAPMAQKLASAGAGFRTLVAC